jgi:hypothetical protein
MTATIMTNQNCRVPIALQEVFLASNRGQEVHTPPPGNIAMRVFKSIFQRGRTSNRTNSYKRSFRFTVKKNHSNEGKERTITTSVRSNNTNSQEIQLNQPHSHDQFDLQYNPNDPSKDMVTSPVSNIYIQRSLLKTQLSNASTNCSSRSSRSNTIENHTDDFSTTSSVTLPTMVESQKKIKKPSAKQVRLYLLLNCFNKRDLLSNCVIFHGLAYIYSSSILG